MNTSVEGLSLVTVIALIRKEIAESRAVGKAGIDGKQGAKGDRGPKGDSGPAGRQGPKGNDGKQGKPGKDGTVGEDGTDGVGIQDIVQDIDGAIVVTMTDGEIYTLELPTGGDTTQVHYKVGGGSSGGGESGSFEVTTDKVKTRSDIIFRDAKGRYKSTKNIPELKNQLEVNRWFVEELESLHVGDAPSDNKHYGRSNGDWAYLSFDSKVGNRRLTNMATARLATNQVLPEYTTEPYFALSNTDGTYSAPEVEQMANYVYLHQYNRIAFNGLESTMIQLEAGDHIEFSNIGAANQCLIMTIITADVEKVGDRYAGVFDFEINGHNWGDSLKLKEGLQYTFHAVKGDAHVPEMTSDATKNTLVLRDENANAKFNLVTTKSITFNYPTIFSNTADTWFLSGGETSAHGVRKNDAAGMRASLNVYSKDEVDGLLVGAFADIQHAIADEKTVAGLKKALTNSLGGLIERLGEAQ